MFVCLFLVEGERHHTPPSSGRKGTQYLITHPTPNPPTHTPTKTPPGGQTCFGNEAPPEALGVNSCTEGCVLRSQHLRTWWGGGGRAEKEGGSGPDGSEEGRWREVVRTQEKKNKDTQKRVKRKHTKCRIDESSNRKRRNSVATKQNRKETEQKETRKEIRE